MKDPTFNNIYEQFSGLINSRKYIFDVNTIIVADKANRMKQLWDIHKELHNSTIYLVSITDDN